MYKQNSKITRNNSLKHAVELMNEMGCGTFTLVRSYSSYRIVNGKDIVLPVDGGYAAVDEMTCSAWDFLAGMKLIRSRNQS